MDRVRSFFHDLGLFDEEDNNKTDSDKSSIDTDTKDTDIEEGAEVVASVPAGDTVSPLYGQESVSPSIVSGSSRLSRLLFTRISSVRSVKSNVSSSIRKITNSMVEEDDYDDEDDVLGMTKDEEGGLKRREARSFTRFRFRTGSNIEAECFPSDRKVESSTKDMLSCKTVIPDDSALDETPANLFGYACGVEFCSSMELMNKIRGIDEENDEGDNDDGFIDENNKDDNNNRALTPMKKMRSFLWKNKATGIEDKISTANQSKAAVDAKTVTTETTIESSSSSIQTKTHLRRWGHSKIWTIAALLFALTGCTCAILTRQSLNFVTLRRPMIITELYEPIDHMGMIRIQICVNASAAASISSLTETGNDFQNFTTTSTTTYGSLAESSECTITRFTREEVSDRLYNLSRSLLTMGSFLGIALTLVLTTSIVWETINLRPIAFGYLVAYFFQSFSMLFFDTELCREYKCQMATGAYLSIITSICWILALIFVVRMDLFKLQSIRLRRREERKAKRENRRQVRKALALRRQQQREQRMIIDNFHGSNNTESFDVLDIETILNGGENYQTAAVEHDKKVMSL